MKHSKMMDMKVENNQGRRRYKIDWDIFNVIFAVSLVMITLQIPMKRKKHVKITQKKTTTRRE